MLLREDLRRGHERGLMAVLYDAESRRGGNHRLAAADVALHEPVHRYAGGEIVQNIIDRALLRASEPEGERHVKRRHAVCPAGLGLAARLPAAQQGQTCGEHEKFLKDQPPPRFIQKLRVQRPVDHFVGHRGGAEAILLPDGLRQNVGERTSAGVQRLRDAGGEHAAGDPGGERVDGHKAARDLPGGLCGFEAGVRHLAGMVGADGAVEDVAFAVDELIFAIGLVEPRERQLPGLIRNARARQLHAAADVGRRGLGDDHGLEAGGHVRLQRGDGDALRPVLIAAREEGDEVVEREDAELFQLAGSGRADALQRRDGRK